MDSPGRAFFCQAPPLRAEGPKSLMRCVRSAPCGGVTTGLETAANRNGACEGTETVMMDLKRTSSRMSRQKEKGNRAVRLSAFQSASAPPEQGASGVEIIRKTEFGQADVFPCDGVGEVDVVPVDVRIGIEQAVVQVGDDQRAAVLQLLRVHLDDAEALPVSRFRQVRKP